MSVFHVTDQAVFKGIIHLVEVPGKESSIPIDAVIRRFLRRFKARAVHSLSAFLLARPGLALSGPERAFRGAELFRDVQFPDEPGRSAGAVQQFPVAGYQKACFFRRIVQQFHAEAGKALMAEAPEKAGSRLRAAG